MCVYKPIVNLHLESWTEINEKQEFKVRMFITIFRVCCCFGHPLFALIVLGLLVLSFILP